jgi:hypothetical protein
MTALQTQNPAFDDDQELMDKVEPENNDEIIEIENPFNPKTIDIRPRTMSLDNIIKRLKENEIDLSPDFQRSGNLWNEQKQSLLIESILIRIPLSAFYFDGSNDDRWLVVDGLQRLSAIKNFVVEKTLRLTGLEFIEQFRNKSFDELPGIFRRQIEEAEIVAYIINSGTPEDVKFNIFKRINTGGLVLNPQEIRNALNQGIPADFIADLANSNAFKQAARLSSDRMLDREFITRFVTFYLYDPADYKPDLDAFMWKAMRELKNIPPNRLQTIKENFESAMYLAKDIFGQRAFRKILDKTDKKTYPVNKALFEVWSVLLAKLTDTERQKIKSKKEEVFDDYVRLINDDSSFFAAITSQTDNKNKILYRFSRIDALLKNRLT